MAVGQFVNRDVLDLFAGEFERLVKGAAGLAHPQLGVEHQERLADRLQDGLVVLRSQFEPRDAALFLVYVHQRDDRAVDLVLAGAVGADAEGIPATLVVLHLGLASGESVDDFADQVVKVVNAEVCPEIAQASANVRGEEIEELFGHWGGTTHGQRVVHHGDRDIDAAEEVGEIVVDLSHFQVAIAQFLVERCEFLVGGLKLFFGGLKLLVRALEFLVARLDLLVGGFELFVGRFLLLDDRLERFLGGVQFGAQPDHSRIVADSSGSAGSAPGRPCFFRFRSG